MPPKPLLMHPGDWLVRRFAYPLHELLRGRRTLAELRTLTGLALQPPALLRDDAAARLRELLRFTSDHSSFYAARFRAAGIAVADPDPFAQLARVPVLDKPTIRAAGAGLVSSRAPTGAFPLSSGGTTGDTLHFFVDRVRQAQTLAARLFMQERVGVRPGERRAYFWGSPIELSGSVIRRWRDRLLNEKLLNAFDLSDDALDAHLQRLEAFQPALLYAYPSAAAALARRAHRTAHRGLAGLRAIVLTGEEVRDEDRAALARVCDCPVVQEYGSREIGLIAHECLHGSLHRLSPHVHVEVLAGGRAAAAGQTGEIVCTTLNTRAQPFIRYRVGDAGALLDGDCACGLTLPRMRLDGGKITGFLALPDGRRCHGAIASHVVRDQPGVVQFKTIQRTLEKFDVLLVTDATFRSDSLTTIERRFRELFGPRVRVDCAIVDHIPPDPSGKRRYVVSEVARDLNAV